MAVFQQGLADPLGDAAMALSVHDQRVDAASDIVDDNVADDLERAPASCGVDLRSAGDLGIRLVARRAPHDEVRAEARADPHQRVADVVAVAEVADANAAELTEPLADRHRVRERLQRVRPVGEAVDHGDRGVLGELLDLLLRKGADEDRAHEAGEHERRVPAALAA